MNIVDFTHHVSLSGLLQVTELTQSLIEHSEILGENIPNLLDTDAGTFTHHLDRCCYLPLESL